MAKRKKRKKSAKKSKRKKTRKVRPKRAAKKKKKAKRKAFITKKKKSQILKSQAAFVNQRKFPRVPVKMKIDYFKDPGIFLYDYSRNLGRGGIFIETETPMVPGTEINLSFTLPDQNEPVEVKGRVTWNHKREGDDPLKGVPGMGVQFTNPEGKDKEALDRFFREIDYDNLTF